MSFRDQRRFARAFVLKNLAGQIPELHAQMTWPNLETSAVADLSYKGMAVGRPGLFPLTVQSKVEIEVELGVLPPFKTQGLIVWANLDWVGLQFTSLPPAGHRAMRDFLDAKLIGAHLRPVEKVFFQAGENFRYWFQGPEQTHVFIWSEDETLIDRVVVDLGGQIVDFRRGHNPQPLTELARRALLVLSQMDKDKLPMEEFVRNLLLGE